MIDNIYSKERNIRKNAILKMLEKDFLFPKEEQEIIKLYDQVELIIDSDDKDIVYFAKKLQKKIKDFSFNNNIRFRENPIDEVYKKNSKELLNLLESPDKIVRINSLYALAKNGCSKKELKALENFAEKATEDEAKLAIDAIEAINNFIESRDKKEKERKQKRELAIKSLKKDQKKKETVKNKVILKKDKNISDENIKRNYFKTFTIILIFTLLLHIIYIYAFFDPYKFVDENNKVLGKRIFFNRIVVLYEKNNGEKSFISLKLTFKGWKKIDK